jgi:hypothetical protein
MKKSISKQLRLLCLLIALTAICMPVKAQQNPPDTSQWHISELSSPDAIFPVVQQRANAYFDAHPEMDSLNPLEKMAFKRWEDFWRNRANIDGTSQPGKLKDVLNAMNDSSLLTYQQDLTAITLPSKWMLITPDVYRTQNLGTVTAIWSNPNDKNFILIGTETSGLWKTTNGGFNWQNISDSYNTSNPTYMAAAGFGVSSIAVDYNSLTNQINAIYITTYLPNTDLLFGHGATILKSTDGGVSWFELPAYNSYILANSGTYYQNMAWKIIFFQNNLYAAIGKRLVVFNTSTSAYNTLFELGVNSPNLTKPTCASIQTQSIFSYNLCRKIRDFEIFQNASGYNICLTTDGLGENSSVTINAEVYYCLHNNTSPFSGIFNWTRIDLISAYGGIIDNAAVEDYGNKFYIAYDEHKNSESAFFKIDEITSTITLNNKLTKEHIFHSLYPEESYVTSSTIGGFFNGFGYRYDAFEVVNDKIMYVGGFNVTKIDLTATPPDVISMNNENILNNNNFNKNEYCHNGIRSIFYQGGNNDLIKIFVGNEGGISTNEVNSLYNINGKGLAINQFANLTTTHTDNRDVIVASSIRNGIWHFEQGANNNEWNQFYWEDGGSSLVNENNPSTIYNFTSWWDVSAPGYAAHLSSGDFHNTTTGIAYTAAPIANPALVCPSFNLQGNIQEITGYYPPIEPSPDFSNGVYLGKHDLWYSNNNGNSGTWSNISNLPGGTFSNFSRNIQAFEVTKNVVCGERIYLAYADPTWWLGDNGQNYGTLPQRKLWRRVAGVWEDITQYVIPWGDYTLAYNGITDIAVNPTNSCELWLTLNQFHRDPYYPQNGIERVLHSTDGGNTWSDYSLGLNSAPVNTIKYFYESGKRLLFIGTDVGVYYRDPEDNSSTWHLLNSPTNPLPRCIVTDIEISYRTNKLRAATLGRGIWDTDILCLNGSPEPDITIGVGSPATTEWNTARYVSNITISAGKTLTIKSNVRFIPNSTLTIDIGGRLILDGGVLEACPDEMWNGVVISGYLESLNTFTEAYHSIIEIKNNGTIKDAIVGINNIGGGVIYMDNANFINNQKAIVVNEFSGNMKIEKSYFMNGNFITNQLYHDATTYPFQHFVELNNVYKLNIFGCKFENKIPVINQHMNPNGYGIKSYNSVYTICERCNDPMPMVGAPCPSQYISKSEFINLDYGIFATNSVKTRNITVKNTIFDNNYRGVCTSNMDNASFTLNTFKIPSVDLQPYNQVSYIGAYGLYLSTCSGYTVEANLFDRTDYAKRASVGMIINNSGSALNTIYNNTLKNIRYAATIAQNNNGINSTADGLKIKCNDYINNRQDIAVVHSQSGISKWQGAGVSNPSDPDKDRKPAGNRFSKIITTGTPDFDNDMGQPIKYFHHNDLGNPNNLWVPQYISSNITLSNEPLAIFNKALSCPTIAAVAGNLPPRSLSSLLQDFGLNTLNYNSAKLILQIWVDGGNTPGLVQTTELAYPWEAYTLYNELMAASPYLSDEVLIAAIQNEDALPPLMLKLILLANPQAVSSGEVMDALLARYNPFPEEWIQELEQGLEVISPREELEADVSYYAGERKTYLDLLKQYYLADTSANAMQNLQQLLVTESDIDSRYELVFAKIANNEFTAANTILENMESALPENDLEISRYYKMREIVPYIIQLYSATDSWENIDQSRIIELSETDEDLPGSLARAIRMHYDESYIYSEPIYVNENIEQKSSTAAKANKTAINADKQYLKLRPNPANDYIVVSYEINNNINGLRLIICNALGKTVYEKELNKPKDELLITLKDYTKGNYIVTLYNNGKVVNSSKIVIQ